MTQLREKGDVAIAISVVFVILIMIVPLNPFLADMFLTVSISLSLLILFIGMYIQKPTRFFGIPLGPAHYDAFQTLPEYRIHAPHTAAWR